MTYINIIHINIPRSSQYGHGPAVYARANDSIRLSRMVMNHTVAHAVLVEQIYRAWTITRCVDDGIYRCIHYIGGI